VKLIRLDKNDKIGDVAKIVLGNENGNENGNGNEYGTNDIEES
jgi:hypothetical protein